MEAEVPRDEEKKEQTQKRLTQVDNLWDLLDAACAGLIPVEHQLERMLDQLERTR